MDEPEQVGPDAAPVAAPLPQVTLTLQPDGNVALRTNVKDARLLNRMLAAGLLGANQEPRPAPGILTGRLVPRLNGLKG